MKIALQVFLGIWMLLAVVTVALAANLADEYLQKYKEMQNTLQAKLPADPNDPVALERFYRQQEANLGGAKERLELARVDGRMSAEEYKQAQRSLALTQELIEQRGQITDPQIQEMQRAGEELSSMKGHCESQMGDPSAYQACVQAAAFGFNPTLGN